MKKLNIGCGAAAHTDWVNIDAVALIPGVQVCDVRAGLPFPANDFDVVYHSHLLEHLARKEAADLLGECLRVLKPGGLLRVVVPDLEAIAKAYLSTLPKTLSQDPGHMFRHDWMVAELTDQCARDRSGGEMSDMIQSAEGDALDFIKERIGSDLVKSAKENPSSPAHTGSLFFRGRGKGRLSRIMRNPRLLREVLLKRLLGREYELLQIGRFRRSGEVHRWMYDEVSLSVLLRSLGFDSIARMGCSVSGIENWNHYRLDAMGDDCPRKPYSVYMECNKRKD